MWSSSFLERHITVHIWTLWKMPRFVSKVDIAWTAWRRWSRDPQLLFFCSLCSLCSLWRLSSSAFSALQALTATYRSCDSAMKIERNWKLMIFDIFLSESTSTPVTCGSQLQVCVSWRFASKPPWKALNSWRPTWSVGRGHGLSVRISALKRFSTIITVSASEMYTFQSFDM